MTIDHTKHSTAHRDRKNMMDSEETISLERRVPESKSAGLGQPMIFLHREVTKEQIAQRAYKIWQERGEPMGQDLDHWLQAESELTGLNFHQT
jgi:hypothetical protein